METQIQQWQLTVPGHDNQATSSPDGFVARLSSLACHLYGMTLNGLSQKLPKSAYRKIERPYSYLRLWCDGYDAPSGNLDNILAESQRLRRSTVQLLASICRTLANRLAPSLKEAVGSPLMQKSAEARELAGVAADAMAEEDSSDSDSDSEDESPPAPGKYSIEDMVQDLETDIQCLLDLGPRYEEPIRDRRLDEKVARAADCATWNPAEYLASRIRHRYPDGDSPLLPVLGKANWDRILRLYQTKEKNERESRNHKARDRLESATVVASEFQDSGLGTSISASHSYAETVVSYHGSSGGPIRVPQLPEEAAGGKPFTCDICGDRVQIPTTRLWKKHVLSDLQPYSCIFPACEFASTPFADKKRWAEHLELDHDFAGAWKDMTCPVCQRHVGSVKTAVISHITRHLEEISLTILPTNAESEGDADDSTDEDSESEKSALGVAVMAKPVSIPRLPPGERRMPPVYPTASFADSFPRTSSQNPGKSNATPNVISSKDTNPVATSYTEDDENTHKDDGHSPTTTMYRCQFKPCPYKSKRKFDCKAHMEEVHAPAKFSMDSLELTFHSVEEANEFARCYRERQVQSLDEVESIAKEEDERFYRANEMAPSQLRDITIAKPVDAMTSNSTTTLPALRNHYEFTHGEQKYSLDEVGVLDVDDGKANDSNEEERRYCLCNGVSYGEMVLCDEHSCKREWFHLACVGLKTAPTALAKWYCPECRSSHVGGAKIPSNRYLPSAVSPGKYKCPECDMEFTENHKLALHICKDGFEKPFECQACQMHFGTVSDLVLHRKLHYDEKINPEGLNFPVDSGNLFSEPQQDSES